MKSVQQKFTPDQNAVLINVDQLLAEKCHINLAFKMRSLYWKTWQLLIIGNNLGSSNQIFNVAGQLSHTGATQKLVFIAECI